MRRWHTRLPEVVSAVQGLIANAERALAAIQAGDFAALGGCLSAYWAQKKVMTAGGEPSSVTKMMNALRKNGLVHGVSLGGGGGGGFLVAITKEPHAKLECKRAIEAAVESSVRAKLSFHGVEIDMDGVCIDGEPVF